MNLFRYIYCLPLWESFFLLVLFSGFAMHIYSKCEDRAARRMFSMGILMFVLYWILSATVVNRTPGSQAILYLQPFASWQRYFSGVNEEGLRANVMNIYLFVPLGLLGSMALTDETPAWKSFVIILLSGILVSCAIEYGQYYYKCGTVEFDDVMHNTLGALWGWLMFCLGRKLKTRLGNHPAD